MRRGRRRAPADQAPVDRPEPPAWLWQFRPQDWPLKDGPVVGDDGSYAITRYAEARRIWRKAARKWLEENDLVLWGHSDIKGQEYQRIKAEEPWRIPRRAPRQTTRAK